MQTVDDAWTWFFDAIKKKREEDPLAVPIMLTCVPATWKGEHLMVELFKDSIIDTCWVPGLPDNVRATFIDEIAHRYAIKQNTPEGSC